MFDFLRSQAWRDEKMEEGYERLFEGGREVPIPDFEAAGIEFTIGEPRPESTENH